MITLTIVPKEWLDTLVLGLFGLAFGLSLTIAQFMHRLDNIRKEQSRAEAESKISQETKNKEITDIKELYERQITELNKAISKLEKKLADKPVSGGKATYSTDPDLEKCNARLTSGGI